MARLCGRRSQLPCALLLLLLLAAARAAGAAQILVYTGVQLHHLDWLDLAQHLQAVGGHTVSALLPEGLRPAAEQRRPGLLATLAGGAHVYAGMAYDPSVSESPGGGSHGGSGGHGPKGSGGPPTASTASTLSRLTARLAFQLHSCEVLLLNRSTTSLLGKPALVLGPAADPCTPMLAARLGAPWVALDDGGATSLLWGVLLRLGHPTSFVATHGTRLGGGAGMAGLKDRIQNAAAYYRLQWWHARTYEPRLRDFRRRHRLPLPVPYGGGGGCTSSGLESALVITAADWGFIEPQALPPNVKVVGPLLPPREALPPALQEFVDGAPHGVTLIYLPHEYRLKFRALMAIAEAVLDLKQRVVWQVGEADLVRVRQTYLPLQHATNIYAAPYVPLHTLLAHPKIVSFIADGSVQSVYAGLTHGKPIIAVALDTEQQDVVARVVALGLGQGLDRHELEGGSASYRLSIAIERMSNVYSYTAHAQRLAAQLAHAPDGSAVQRAAGWVEYALAVRAEAEGAAGGAATAAGRAFAGSGQHLVPAGVCMPWWAAYNVVAHAVLLAAALAGLALVVLVFHVCTRMPVAAPPAAPHKKVIKAD